MNIVEIKINTPEVKIYRLVPEVKSYKLVTNRKTQEVGFYCNICGQTQYDSYCITKKYCPVCPLHHELGNYLSFI